MTTYAKDLWLRAVNALKTAKHDLAVSCDAAASRSYYAAFYAASALFALSDASFTKHPAVEAAVHSDLVKTGRWSRDLGEDYSVLRRLRGTGDYGGSKHVSPEGAADGIERAGRILDAVRRASPDVFCRENG